MSEIGAILLILMLMVVVTAVIFGVLAGVGAWSLNRRNRLAPDIETGAPMHWLWAPTQPARLHRRLQRAVAPVHEPAPKERRRNRAAHAPPMDVVIGPASTIEDVCRAITGQATAVDREVVQVARLPRRARRSKLRLLQGEVTQIERLTVRVHEQRAAQARPATIGDAPRTRGEALGHLDQHLDAIADAHAELHAIERANGLDDPDRILDAIHRGDAAPVGPPAGARPAPLPPPPAPPRPPAPRPTAAGPRPRPQPHHRPGA